MIYHIDLIGKFYPIYTGETLRLLDHTICQDACAKASSAQQALRALQRATDAKLQPNAMTYNAVGRVDATCVWFFGR